MRSLAARKDTSSKHQTYRIDVPFQLPDGRAISVEKHHEVKVKVGNFTTQLTYDYPFYKLRLSGVPNNGAASRLFGKVVTGLYWAAIKHGIGIRLSSELQKPYYAADPVKAAKNIFGKDRKEGIDGAIDGGQPAIYPEDKRLASMTAMPVHAVMSLHPVKFLEALDEGVTVVNPKSIDSISALKLAIELYCFAKFEASSSARFLILCIVLEVLAPQVRSTYTHIRLIEDWMHEVSELAKQHPTDSPEYEELVRLRERLGNLKTPSHSERLQTYVRAVINEGNGTDGDQVAEDVKKLYGHRGKAMHEGSLDLGDEVSQLDLIVRRILEIEMRLA